MLERTEKAAEAIADLFRSRLDSGNLVVSLGVDEIRRELKELGNQPIDYVTEHALKLV
jgi:hypothetical protein